MNKPHRPPDNKAGTKLTLNAGELEALARYVSASQVLLQTRHPGVTRQLRAGFTRLELKRPAGL